MKNLKETTNEELEQESPLANAKDCATKSATNEEKFSVDDMSISETLEDHIDGVLDLMLTNLHKVNINGQWDIDPLRLKEFGIPVELFEDSLLQVEFEDFIIRPASNGMSTVVVSSNIQGKEIEEYLSKMFQNIASLNVKLIKS